MNCLCKDRGKVGGSGGSSTFDIFPFALQHQRSKLARECDQRKAFRVHFLQAPFWDGSTAHFGLSNKLLFIVEKWRLTLSVIPSWTPQCDSRQIGRGCCSAFGAAPPAPGWSPTSSSSPALEPKRPMIRRLGPALGRREGSNKVEITQKLANYV